MTSLQLTEINVEHLALIPRDAKIKTLNIDQYVDLSGWKIEKIIVNSDYLLGTNTEIKAIKIYNQAFINNLSQHEYINELYTTVDLYEKLNIKASYLNLVGESLSQSMLDEILLDTNIRSLSITLRYKQNLFFKMENNNTLEELITSNVIINPFNATTKIFENKDRIRFLRMKPVM